MTLEEQFAQALAKDPDLLNKLRRGSELQEFKEKYNVLRATPFKCPSCSQWMQTGGSLWIDKDNPHRFVCRKCKLVWIMNCETLPIGELIIKIREAAKAPYIDAWDKER